MNLDELKDAPTGRLLAVAGHVAARRWSLLLAEKYGLTVAGMTVLFTLHKDGGLGHREMAHRCFIRPATLTGIVDTLVKAGYVERHRDTPDRRSVRLALTATGEATASEIYKLVERRAPLTSVDADPAKEAVVREFLLEIIGTLGTGEEVL